MIKIKNTQKKIKIDEKEVYKIAHDILTILDYSNFDLGIWLTTNQTIRKYNKLYRKKDKPTDILSFQFYEKIKPGERIVPKPTETKDLGDLIISLEYAKKDADKQGKLLIEHLKKLLAHGICHLIGYEHETDQDYKKMQARESYILKKLDGLDN